MLRLSSIFYPRHGRNGSPSGGYLLMVMKPVGHTDDRALMSARGNVRRTTRILLKALTQNGG